MRLIARMIGGIGLPTLVVAGLIVTPTAASATSSVIGHREGRGPNGPRPSARPHHELKVLKR